MAAALIVIEIAAPQVSDDALSVLVSACTRAARDAECVLAKNASDAQPAAVAIVSLQAEDKMRVEVGVHQGDHDSWRTKDFAFLAADDPLDRWRAVGFAIGTLAESEPAPDSNKPSEPAAARATPATPASTGANSNAPGAATPSSNGGANPHSTRPAAAAEAPDSEERMLQRPLRPATSPRSHVEVGPLSIGAAAIFGPGLDSGPWRMGGELSAALALQSVPMFVTLGGSAATRVARGSSDVSARWFDVSLGAGLPLFGAPWESGLELRAAVIAEYFDAEASVSERSQARHRATFGAEGAFGGRLRLVGNLVLTSEVQAAGFSGDTEVRVAGTSVGSNPSFRVLGSVGLRVVLR